MKLYQRSGFFKASNVIFRPQTCEAFSYGWWRFVAKIEGKVVFNNYRYSNTTARHQWKVRRLLDQLGITIDIEAPFSEGIPNDQLENIIFDAEMNLCDQFLAQEAGKISKSEKAKAKRYLAKLARLGEKNAETQEDKQNGVDTMGPRDVHPAARNVYT